MSEKKIDPSRIKSITERLLFGLPEAQRALPFFSSGQPSTFTFLTDAYFLCAILSKKEVMRVKQLTRNKLDPFPGFVKPDAIVAPCAFVIKNSKNGLFSDNQVANMYAFSLGKDCTLVVQNHKQSIKTKEHGNYKYTIDLAYLISFGDEINTYNFYSYFEDLVAFSLRQWRG